MNYYPREMHRSRNNRVVLFTFAVLFGFLIPVGLACAASLGLISTRSLVGWGIACYVGCGYCTCQLP